ncbi:radical SAM family heme chaperone HemW [Clostridium guangxiense]|uniref:radical SAM family heme chaperone HemW n=1 Tax=Clostridium guangxiense TaxID=1662055 RepID=UPI001E3DBC9F|nr:radical SAM family heme chaperone HemW [Clostridium guangxiense]MCD2347531.1 radical SAM family heme chaperone HemW [Clostridium guangxiense]
MGKLGLYIHIPFCKKKCLYCDFPSYSCMEKYMLDYVKALCLEIENKCKGKRFNTIFIGGGTPSYLSMEAWEILKETLHKVNKHEDCEFTVECNPGSFDKDKLEVIKTAGANRISIGLQACQNELLASLGRIHNFSEFLKGFEMARNIGFKNINVDLMFAIPGQSFEQWKETLEKVSNLNPEHISCYSLIVEEGTPFYKMKEEGKLALPEEDVEVKMYNFTVEFLRDNGYKQYEISNFSKEHKECKHNLIYWSMDEYIGCGASAHSYFNNIRNKNESNVKRYIEKILSYEDTSVEKHENSTKDNMEEFMFLGLRKTNGIRISDFKSKFNVNIYDIYGAVVNKYEKLGLIKIESDKVFLTEKAVHISNTIMSDFILE